ncbi:hypothetical protein CPSG_09065 [Coccidioides posadasii str. Silveira]|uniref:Uncharacterized protein n=1 Tax=Coccidioides posadasii (strain RMSCC 757 / Silveira) TaxID=443226 RepID=E9DGW6_COCPS|nr:hypothetical protein CPSG_09065 [Coccidioides posadasii str. Silveira]
MLCDLSLSSLSSINLQLCQLPWDTEALSVPPLLFHRLDTFASLPPREAIAGPQHFFYPSSGLVGLLHHLQASQNFPLSQQTGNGTHSQIRGFTYLREDWIHEAF